MKPDSKVFFNISRLFKPKCLKYNKLIVLENRILAKFSKTIFYLPDNQTLNIF